jgi:hypothetical protein
MNRTIPPITDCIWLGTGPIVPPGSVRFGPGFPKKDIPAMMKNIMPIKTLYFGGTLNFMRLASNENY